MRKKVKIYCDGGARGNPGPAASAFVAVEEDGGVLKAYGERIGRATNNVAEYTAVVLAMEWLCRSKDGIGQATFFLDSQLVANQLSGQFKIRNRGLLVLALKIKTLKETFSGSVSYRHIPRYKNRLADNLVNKALDNAG